MTQLKKHKDNYKRIRKKARNKTVNSKLIISVKDKMGKIYNCDISVIETEHFQFRKNGMINRETTIYFPVVANDQNWEIPNLKGRRVRISDLKNKTVNLLQGTKRISGTIVGIMMDSGGATSPPVGGTLPPVDE